MQVAYCKIWGFQLNVMGYSLVDCYLIFYMSRKSLEYIVTYILDQIHLKTKSIILNWAMKIVTKSSEVVSWTFFLETLGESFPERSGQKSDKIINMTFAAWWETWYFLWDLKLVKTFWTRTNIVDLKYIVGEWKSFGLVAKPVRHLMCFQSFFNVFQLLIQGEVPWVWQRLSSGKVAWLCDNNIGRELRSSEQFRWELGRSTLWTNDLKKWTKFSSKRQFLSNVGESWQRE